MKSWTLRVRSTVIEEYIIDAPDSAQARRLFMAGAISSGPEREIERPDIEVVSIMEIK